MMTSEIFRSKLGPPNWGKKGNKSKAKGKKRWTMTEGKMMCYAYALSGMCIGHYKGYTRNG